MGNSLVLFLLLIMTWDRLKCVQLPGNTEISIKNTAEKESSARNSKPNSTLLGTLTTYGILPRVRRQDVPIFNPNETYNEKESYQNSPQFVSIEGNKEFQISRSIAEGTCLISHIKETSVVVTFCEEHGTKTDIQLYAWNPCRGCNRTETTYNCKQEITNLCPYQHYSVVVPKPNDDDVLQCEFNTLPSDPDPVKELVVANKTSVTVILTWNRPPCINAEKLLRYEIELSTDGADKVTNLLTSGLENLTLEYVYDDLTAWTDYTFLVKACTDVDHCNKGVVVEATTSPEKPEIPQNFTGQPLGAYSVNLSWKNPKTWNGPGTGFTLEWMIGNTIVNTTVLNTVELETTNSVIVSDLRAWTDYKFILKAFNDNGTTNLLSEGVSFETKTGTSEDVDATGLSVSKRTAQSVTLKWKNADFSRSNHGFKYYKLQVYTKSRVLYCKEYKEIENAHEIATHVVVGLKPWTEYEFAIQKCSSTSSLLQKCTNGIIASAATLSGEPLKPEKFTATVLNTGSVVLSWAGPKTWNGPGGGFILAWINMNPMNFGLKSKFIEDESITVHTIDGLQQDNAYTFVLKAFNRVENGGFLLSPITILTDVFIPSGTS